ncbi:MAG: hypothetical protein ITD31_05805 [Nitrosospira sp.]|nr:hypothetical protein [Nitrosospira sp.]
MNHRKFTIKLVVLIFAMQAGLSIAENRTDGNPQPKTEGESDLISFIDGCHPKIKPSCQARVVCTGSNVIHGNDPRSIQLAMKIATAKANAELVKFIGNKVKVLEEIKQLDKTYGKESGAGKQTQKELGELSNSVISTSGEEFLQGVRVIGGMISIEDSVVRVVIGQSCDSVSTAQGIKGKMQQGQAQREGNSSGGTANSSENSTVIGGPEVHFGATRSRTQKPTDDF